MRPLVCALLAGLIVALTAAPAGADDAPTPPAPRPRIGAAWVASWMGGMVTAGDPGPYPLASSVKPIIALRAFDRAEQEGRAMTPAELSAVEWMIAVSDNEDAAWLWDEMGASDGMRAWLLSEGLWGIEPMPNDDWGDTEAGPAAAVWFLIRLLQGSLATREAHETVIDAMTRVTYGQRWGALGVLDGMLPDAITGGKNGWWPNHDGWWVSSLAFARWPDGAWFALAVLCKDADTQAEAIERIEAWTRDILVASGAATRGS